MKKIFKSVSMLTVMLAVLAIFSSCTKEDIRDDYAGSYRTNFEFTQDGQVQSGTYTLTIVKSATNVNDIILNNIDGWGESVRATVSGNAFTIPQQTIQDVGISGSGTLNGNVLNFSTQEVQTGGVPINVIQVATKQ
jgi:hypothetical protein